MAKKLVYNYVFDASAQTVTIDGNWTLRTLILITNVTDNIIIYNFADSSAGGSVAYDAINEKTVITLTYNTATMSDSDELQILVDEQEARIDVSESLLDPVNKFRVSAPENLIDTDFEYGLQPTKWETIELVSNIPSVYTRASGVSIGGIFEVNTTANSDSVVVITSIEHDLSVGDPIEVQGTSSRTANGKYIVTNVTNDFRFSYRASAVQSTTGNIKTAYTTIIPGSFFVGSEIIFDESEGVVTDGASPSGLTVTTLRNHGLNSDTSVYLTNTIGAKEFTIPDTGTYYGGYPTIYTADNTIYLLNNGLDVDQNLTIYPDTASNASAELPSLNAGAPAPSGSTTVQNVYNSVVTAIGSVKTTMGTNHSRILISRPTNQLNNPYYVDGTFTTTAYDGAGNQTQALIYGDASSSWSIYMFDSTNQRNQYFRNTNQIPIEQIATGQAIDWGSYFTRNNPAFDTTTTPLTLSGYVTRVNTPFSNNSYTDAIINVTEYRDPGAISANTVKRLVYENSYFNKRAINNQGWATNSGNTEISLGNGWYYTWTQDYIYPQSTRCGFWKVQLNIWNDNWSGYIGGNSAYYYYRVNNQTTFMKREANYRGTMYHVEALVGVTAGTSIGNFGNTGSVLTNAQFASTIANQIVADNSLASWTNGSTSSNTVKVASVTDNRITIKSTTNQPFDFSSRGTGPIVIKTDSTAGILDNYFQISSTTSNTFELSGGTLIPNRTLEFTDAEVVAFGGIYYIYISTGHGLKTGQKVVFNVDSGTEPGGLTDGTTYYVRVVDNKYLRLSATLQGAEFGGSGGNIITSSGSGSFNFTISAISGRGVSSGTIETSESSSVVTGTNTKFLAIYKPGDTFTMLTETNSTGPRSYIENTVKSVVSDTSLTLDSAAGITTTGENHFVDTKIHVRADGTFIHRPFDGGVEITAGRSPDSQIVRQTRKYFRYQSGKGIQCSMAINFNPFRPARLVTGTVGQSAVTVVTEYPHGLTNGDVVKVQGAEETSTYTPSNATYDPSTGDLVLTRNGHGFQAGEYITLAENSLTFTCDKDGNATNHTYPRSSDPAGRNTRLLITSVTTNTFTVNVGTSSYGGAHTFVSAASNAVTHIDTSNAYNGSFTVTNASTFSFGYTSTGTVQQYQPGGFIEYAISDYTNAGIRAGLFDFQNGFFFEYNGKNLYAVRRSSVQQVPGTISVTNKSNRIEGTNTRFTANLQNGDMVVIRGQSYKIVNLISDTSMDVQPYYRGTTSNGVIMTKTIDTRVPQSQWNIDKADGSGPSGYLLDINKIQMVYLDYSWYGAGKIRFGFKDTKGHVKYTHEFIHNNRLNEAYMRSGNIPARYEAYNLSTPTYVPSLFHWGTSVIMDGGFDDDDSYLFTAAGQTLTFTNGDSNTATTTGNSRLMSRRVYGSLRDYYVEIPFSGTDSSKFSVGIPLYTSGGELNGETVNFTNIDGSNINVYIYIGRFYSSPAIYPSVTTGTSVSIGAAASGSSTAVDLNTLIPLISIRLAPSVDNNLIGPLGDRDIINRMQLKLKELGISVSHDTKVTVILNGNLSNLSYQNVGTPSLSEYIAHDIGDTINGGITIYSFRASGGSTDSTGKRLSVSSAFDLSGLSDLGNSILGGDDVFPNGPDIVTICATVIDTSEVDAGSSFRVASRLSWAESQA